MIAELQCEQAPDVQQPIHHWVQKFDETRSVVFLFQKFDQSKSTSDYQTYHILNADQMYKTEHRMPKIFKVDGKDYEFVNSKWKRVINREANDILSLEMDNWEWKTYEEIRNNSERSGFTSEYLWKSANFTEFSTSAKVPIMMQLAKLDLQKETSITELVFSCCLWFPKKDALQSLIELGKQTQSEEEVVRAVFGYSDHNGMNCLKALSDLKSRCKRTIAPSPMLGDIEESRLYLIDLAKSSTLDLDRILTHTANDETTFIFEASTFSAPESIEIISIVQSLTSTTSDRVR